MYLKQLTINGFKSFADQTLMNLQEGITCIVGPNGCGKSNIVDSIRWVLGEQSAKALRGGKMHDVIFQGTQKRKPLQFAEVALLFSDCEKQLGTNFNEVEISRKVFRDGASSYYINGKSARLKDIQNLFMDTGIGRVSYSFMVQGQIDQILSSNPNERRAIFEEAAGITKYKTQRKEALNKLALVDQNLARVTDRIEEISRQIGTLKRQATKAFKYKKFTNKLRHLDLAINARNFQKNQDDLACNADKLLSLETHITKIANELRISQESSSAQRSLRAEVMINMEAIRQNLAEVRSQKELAQNNSDFAKIRKEDLQVKILQFESEIEALKDQMQNLAGQAQGDSQVKQLHLNLVTDSNQTFKVQAEELQEVESQLSALELALSSLKQDILVNEGAIVRLRSDCTGIELELKSFEVKHSALSDSIYQLKEELVVLEERAQEFNLAKENSDEELANVQADITQYKNTEEELRLRYRTQQEHIQNMDRQIAVKSAKLALLNDLQTKLEGFSEGVKAILRGQIADVFPAEKVKIVSQNVEVKEGWISAFEELLGSAIDAIVLEEESSLETILNAFKEKDLGNACFQIESVNFEDSDISLSEGIYRAVDIVKTKDIALEKFAKNLLKGCYFCEDLKDFIDFVNVNKGFKFLSVISRDMQILDSRGLVYAKKAQQQDTQSSFIYRAQEIRRLKDEIVFDNNALTELTEVAMSIQAQLDEVALNLEQKKNLSGEVKRQLASLEAQIQGLRVNVSQKEVDLSQKSEAIVLMENSKFETSSKLDIAQKNLEEAQLKINQGRASINENEEQIMVLRHLKDDKNAVLSQTRLDLATKKSKLESLEKGLDLIKQQQEDLKISIELKQRQLNISREQIVEFEQESLKQSEKAKVLVVELDKLNSDLELKKVEISQIEEELSENERVLNLNRQEHIKLSSSKNELDVKIAQVRANLEHIDERIVREYELKIEKIDWKSEYWYADELIDVKVKIEDLEEDGTSINVGKKIEEPTEKDLSELDLVDFSIVEEQLRELRQKISQMGAVNLVAIEEYAQLKQRYEFLKAQSEDLWESKNGLIKDIDEINQTSQEMFAQTFEQIRKNFGFTFEKVFGGGTADLKLIASEDVLDSGIEIIARPPGTLLKSLSLLSGGQRTMTAVSLLFAIYMVKPSPFCVLDELDAPLDDANIARYTDLLKEFTKYSQFLVISHNKRTVSAADTIYGVTMQERGVTRLISMRFNKDKDEAVEEA